MINWYNRIKKNNKIIVFTSKNYKSKQTVLNQNCNSNNLDKISYMIHEYPINKPNLLKKLNKNKKRKS